MAGSYTFTVSASDANGCLGAQIYTIVVQAQACPIIVLSPGSIPDMIANRPFNQSFVASGGTSPYVISVTAGALPNGLQLSSTGPSSASITGEPTSVENFAFSLTATDADNCATTNNYAGNIQSLPAIISIPATSNWGLWLMILLLPLVGLVVLRR